MRTSSKTLQLQWLADIYRRQAEIARVQKQVTSGLRISTAKDDPAGAAQVVSLRQGLDRLANYAANAEAARRRLSLEENALDEMGDAVARVRELAVQAGSGAQTPDTRRAIATELREIFASLVDLANAQDGEGRYLFAGNEVAGEPVTVVAGIAQYNGDAGVRVQRIGDSRTVREGDAGSEVFFAIRNGNGTFFVQPGTANQGTGYFTSATVTDAAAWAPDNYTITFTSATDWSATNSAGATIASGTWSPGAAITFAGATVALDGQPAAGDTFLVRTSVNRSMFGMLNGLITGLDADSVSPQGRAAFQNMLNATLLNLDRVEEQLNDVRSSVGARLAAVDEQNSSNGELALQLESTLSTLRDVDYAQAVSRLETELTGLEAAQKVFAQTRTLSLFDLL
jgi:flagellar hook-associated protein 3 FlgL